LRSALLLFIYGSFNESFSTSDYATLNDTMIGETDTDFTIRSETVVFIENSKQNLHDSLNP
jgi:hypothetical protein